LSGAEVLFGGNHPVLLEAGDPLSGVGRDRFADHCYDVGLGDAVEIAWAVGLQ